MIAEEDQLCADAPHPAILAEINKGISAARRAYPESIPHFAEDMAAATLVVAPLTTTNHEEENEDGTSIDDGN